MNKKLILVALLGVAFCSFLFGQTLTEQFHLQYNNGVDKITKDYQPVLGVTGIRRLSFTQNAQPGTNTVSYSGGAPAQPPGWLVISTFGSNGTSIFFSFDNTNFPIMLTSGDPPPQFRVPTNSTTIYEYGTVSNVPFSVDIFPN